MKLFELKTASTKVEQLLRSIYFDWRDKVDRSEVSAADLEECKKNVIAQLLQMAKSALEAENSQASSWPSRKTHLTRSLLYGVAFIKKHVSWPELNAIEKSMKSHEAA